MNFRHLCSYEILLNGSNLSAWKSYLVIIHTRQVVACMFRFKDCELRLDCNYTFVVSNLTLHLHGLVTVTTLKELGCIKVPTSC